MQLKRQIARKEQAASEAAAEAEVAHCGLQRRVQHLMQDVAAARAAQRGAEADAAEARRAVGAAAAAAADSEAALNRQLGTKTRQVESMAEKLILQKKVRGAGATHATCPCTQIWRLCHSSKATYTSSSLMKQERSHRERC